MSTPPRPPERLAEILLEILALSKPTGMDEPECIRGSDPNECRTQSQANDLTSKTVEPHKDGRTLRD
jgi:hypothetical protein